MSLDHSSGTEAGVLESGDRRSAVVPSAPAPGHLGAHELVVKRQPNYHLVLHREFDLGRIATEAGDDRGPRHVMGDVARELDAKVHFSVPADAIRWRDRLFGAALFSAEAWAQARDVLTHTTPGDVVYVNDNTGLALGLLNALRGHPVKLWELVTWPDNRMVKLFGRLVKWLGGVDRWSSNTVDKTEQLRVALGLPAAEMIAVTEDVDSAFFRPGDTATVDGLPLVFSAGREGRDYASLAAAVEGLGVETIVCAVSPSNPDPKTMTVPERLPENFRFEMLPWPVFRAAYHRASVVVVPLLDRHGSPGLSVMIEAMACRRPVVVTSVSGYVSQLVEAGVVIGVPVGDVAALHAAIERVLGDPQLAEELAERGYRYVIEHHTTEQFVHTMVQGMRGLGEGVTSR